MWLSHWHDLRKISSILILLITHTYFRNGEKQMAQQKMNLQNLLKFTNSRNAQNAAFGSKKLKVVIIWAVDVDTNSVIIVVPAILVLVEMIHMFEDKLFIYSSLEPSLKPCLDFFDAMLSTNSGKKGRTYCAMLALKRKNEYHKRTYSVVITNSRFRRLTAESINWAHFSVDMYLDLSRSIFSTECTLSWNWEIT